MKRTVFYSTILTIAFGVLYVTDSMAIADIADKWWDSRLQIQDLTNELIKCKKELYEQSKT